MVLRTGLKTSVKFKTSVQLSASAVNSIHAGAPHVNTRRTLGCIGGHAAHVLPDVEAEDRRVVLLHDADLAQHRRWSRQARICHSVMR